MKYVRSYKITSVIVASFLLFGCSTVANKKIKKSTLQNKPQKTTGISLATLKSLGVKGVLLKAKPLYVENEAIRFIVDTGKAEGYLYIVYLDNNGETGLLYPNANSPLSEMGGKFLFPRDFGNMNIRATKDCKGCNEEKTSIYALLSKSPILDINSITKTDLLNLTSSSPQTKTRGLALELHGQSRDNSNLRVGRVDFLVK